MGFDGYGLTPPSPSDAVTVRVGTVEAVDTPTAGVVTVQIAGQSLTHIPYAAGLLPIVGKPVWVMSQGSWMAVMGAADTTGQAGHTHPTSRSGVWRYSSSTTMADPGSGYVRWSADGTQVALSVTTRDGIDASAALADMQVGDQIRVQVKSDASNVGWWDVTAVTDNGAWLLFDVTSMGGSPTAPTNNTELILTFTYNSSAGVGGGGDARYVNVTGDTMTGNLTVDKADGAIVINSHSGGGSFDARAPAGSNKGLWIRNYGGPARWSLLATAEPESGSDSGSNFAIYRYSDAGAYLGAGLSINRATGRVTVSTDPVGGLDVATKQYVDNAPFVNESGDSMSGALVNDNYPITAMRGGKLGHHRSSASSVTGALLIEMPPEWRSAMANFRVEGYNYGTGRGWGLNLGGYLYRATTPYWPHTYAHAAYGVDTFPQVQTVRFLGKGTSADGSDRHAILIGSVTDTWVYPQIALYGDLGFNAVGGASAASVPATISFVTDVSAWTRNDAPNEAEVVATRAYADGIGSAKVNKSGDTMTGSLVFNNQVTLGAKNTSGATETFLWPRWSDNRTYMNYGSGGFSLRTQGSATAMAGDNSGYLTLGQVTPVSSSGIASKGYVDGLLNLGSATATLASGWSAYAGPYLERVGKMVSFQALFYNSGSALSLASNTNYLMATIPAGYRPTQDTSSVGIALTTEASPDAWRPARISIVSSSGSVYIMLNGKTYTMNNGAWCIVNATWRTA